MATARQHRASAGAWRQLAEEFGRKALRDVEALTAVPGVVTLTEPERRQVEAWLVASVRDACYFGRLAQMAARNAQGVK